MSPNKTAAPFKLFACSPAKKRIKILSENTSEATTPSCGDGPSLCAAEEDRKKKRRRGGGDDASSSSPLCSLTNGSYPSSSPSPSPLTPSSSLSPSSLASSSSLPPSPSFVSLGVPPWLLRLSRSLQIVSPTPIQRLALPDAFKGSDLLGVAPTGTGKTVCYCWPILAHLATDPYGIHSLVILPSRELALQVAEQLRAFGSSICAHVVTVVGGLDWNTQVKQLTAGPHVVIATPGRLMQAMQDEDVVRKFKYLHCLVLDEVDYLMEDSFEEDLEQLMSLIPRQRQTLCFTATFTADIMTRSAQFSSGNLKLVDATAEPDLSHLQQKYLFVTSRVRLAYLHHMLQDAEFAEVQGIIFVATCRECQQLNTTLEILGYSVTCLHSLHNQRRRAAHLGKFRSEISRILVATDVASRGLDIPKVGFVVNFDFPLTPRTYTHRVGRTARAGRQGTAVSMVTERDVDRVLRVEEAVGTKLQLLETQESKVLKGLSAVTRAQRKAALLLSEVGFEDKAEALHKLRADSKQHRRKRKAAA
eukprot:GHVS01074280.1.p1 GENE.GHVS01074280.1~~GHVS01074280.1.p1  ORF type:complete len:531 (-),score=110.77 GHVS01074280.1:257-1849(-)